jgi:hypothetical protein
MLALVCAACATAPRAPEEGGGEWLRADGELVSVETALGASLARSIVDDVANLRVAMAAAVLPGAPPLRQHLEVVVLQNRELEALSQSLRGLFADHRYVGPVLLLGATDRWERPRVMKHELAHSVVDELLHHRAPQWLDEGLAVDLESVALDSATGEMSWGALPPENSIMRTAPRVYSADLLSGERWPLTRLGEYEYSAGFMVHMLAHRHPDELGCLLKRLNERDSYQHALAICCPSQPQWGFEYSHEDSATGGGRLGSTRIVPSHEAPEIMRLGNADVHSVLALIDLHVAQFRVDPADRARLQADSARRVRRALELDAGHILASTLELSASGFKGDQRARTARLVDAHPDDWRAWFWRAATGGLPAQESLQATLRVIELAPERDEVVELAEDRAQESGTAAAATIRAELARARQPRRRSAP